MNEKMMSSLVYPAVIILSIGTYAFSSSRGGSIPLSAFGAVVLGAVLIVLFEQLIPYQLKWRPRPEDIKDDLLYTAFIQIAFPRVLGFFIVLLLANQIGADAPFAEIWPREWPVAAQA
jgi:hypothetical protein